MRNKEKMQAEITLLNELNKGLVSLYTEKHYTIDELKKEVGEWCNKDRVTK